MEFRIDSSAVPRQTRGHGLYDALNLASHLNKHSHNDAGRTSVRHRRSDGYEKDPPSSNRPPDSCEPPGPLFLRTTSRSRTLNSREEVRRAALRVANEVQDAAFGANGNFGLRANGSSGGGGLGIGGGAVAAGGNFTDENDRSLSMLSLEFGTLKSSRPDERGLRVIIPTQACRRRSMRMRTLNTGSFQSSGASFSSGVFPSPRSSFGNRLDGLDRVSAAAIADSQFSPSGQGLDRDGSNGMWMEIRGEAAKCFSEEKERKWHRFLSAASSPGAAHRLLHSTSASSDALGSNTSAACKIAAHVRFAELSGELQSEAAIGQLSHVGDRDDVGKRSPYSSQNNRRLPWEAVHNLTRHPTSGAISDSVSHGPAELQNRPQNLPSFLSGDTWKYRRRASQDDIRVADIQTVTRNRARTRTCFPRSAAGLPDILSAELTPHLRAGIGSEPTAIDQRKRCRSRPADKHSLTSLAASAASEHVTPVSQYSIGEEQDIKKPQPSTGDVSAEKPTNYRIGRSGSKRWELRNMPGHFTGIAQLVKKHPEDHVQHNTSQDLQLEITGLESMRTAAANTTTTKNKLEASEIVSDVSLSSHSSTKTRGAPSMSLLSGIDPASLPPGRKRTTACAPSGTSPDAFMVSSRTTAPGAPLLRGLSPPADALPNDAYRSGWSTVDSSRHQHSGFVSCGGRSTPRQSPGHPDSVTVDTLNSNPSLLSSRPVLGPGLPPVDLPLDVRHASSGSVAPCVRKLPRYTRRCFRPFHTDGYATLRAEWVKVSVDGRRKRTGESEQCHWRQEDGTPASQNGSRTRQSSKSRTTLLNSQRGGRSSTSHRSTNRLWRRTVSADGRVQGWGAHLLRLAVLDLLVTQPPDDVLLLTATPKVKKDCADVKPSKPDADASQSSSTTSSSSMLPCCSSCLLSGYASGASSRKNRANGSVGLGVCPFLFVPLVFPPVRIASQEAEVFHRLLLVPREAAAVASRRRREEPTLVLPSMPSAPLHVPLHVPPKVALRSRRRQAAVQFEGTEPIADLMSAKGGGSNRHINPRAHGSKSPRVNPQTVRTMVQNQGSHTPNEAASPPETVFDPAVAAAAEAAALEAVSATCLVSAKGLPAPLTSSCSSSMSPTAGFSPTTNGGMSSTRCTPQAVLIAAPSELLHKHGHSAGQPPHEVNCSSPTDCSTLRSSVLRAVVPSEGNVSRGPSDEIPTSQTNMPPNLSAPFVSLPNSFSSPFSPETYCALPVVSPPQLPPINSLSEIKRDHSFVIHASGPPHTPPIRVTLSPVTPSPDMILSPVDPGLSLPPSSAQQTLKPAGSPALRPTSRTARFFDRLTTASPGSSRSSSPGSVSSPRTSSLPGALTGEELEDPDDCRPRRLPRSPRPTNYSKLLQLPLPGRKSLRASSISSDGSSFVSSNNTCGTPSPRASTPLHSVSPCKMLPRSSGFQLESGRPDESLAPTLNRTSRRGLRRKTHIFVSLDVLESHTVAIAQGDGTVALDAPNSDELVHQRLHPESPSMLQVVYDEDEDDGPSVVLSGPHSSNRNSGSWSPNRLPVCGKGGAPQSPGGLPSLPKSGAACKSLTKAPEDGENYDGDLQSRGRELETLRETSSYSNCRSSSSPARQSADSVFVSSSTGTALVPREPADEPQNTHSHFDFANGETNATLLSGCHRSVEDLAAQRDATAAMKPIGWDNSSSLRGDYEADVTKDPFMALQGRMSSDTSPIRTVPSNSKWTSKLSNTFALQSLQSTVTRNLFRLPTLPRGSSEAEDKDDDGEDREIVEGVYIYTLCHHPEHLLPTVKEQGLLSPHNTLGSASSPVNDITRQLSANGSSVFPREFGAVSSGYPPGSTSDRLVSTATGETPRHRHPPLSRWDSLETLLRTKLKRAPFGRVTPGSASTDAIGTLGEHDAPHVDISRHIASPLKQNKNSCFTPPTPSPGYEKNTPASPAYAQIVKSVAGAKVARHPQVLLKHLAVPYARAVEWRRKVKANAEREYALWRIVTPQSVTGIPASLLRDKEIQLMVLSRATMPIQAINLESQTVHLMRVECAASYVDRRSGIVKRKYNAEMAEAMTAKALDYVLESVRALPYLGHYFVCKAKTLPCIARLVQTEQNNYRAICHYRYPHVVLSG
eukprot:GHVT01060265.1.p1 GENE.GHVT01060265.1~~GHVT01060265.1.p1  ORF type:complete len:2111 (-),score=196.49 GHVT01060265.1:5859-12191(-)